MSSETTNDCARHKNNAAHQRQTYRIAALAMFVACVAVCVAVTNYVMMMLMFLGTHMTPMTSLCGALA